MSISRSTIGARRSTLPFSATWLIRSIVAVRLAFEFPAEVYSQTRASWAHFSENI